MLLFQALSFICFGLTLTAAQNKCLDPLSTWLVEPAKTSVTCATDAECAAFPGYFCAAIALTTQNSKICCAAQDDCDVGFVAKFAATGDPALCADQAPDCATAFGASFVCQNLVCCAPVQPPPVTCTPGVTVNVGGVCKPLVAMGAACDDVAQCPWGSGAICNVNCICPVTVPPMVIVNNVCKAPVALGGQCEDTAQCVAITPTSLCGATKLCECPPNNMVTAGPPSTCTPCVDPKPIVYMNNCEAKRNLAQSCKGTPQCPVGAACTGGFCVCPAGFLANGVTECVRCDANTQVLVPGAPATCYPKASYGVSCVVPAQCTFTNGVCTGAPMTCQCVAGNVWDGTACMPCGAGKVIANNKCYDLSAYGAACQVNPQCGTYTNGICIAGQCTCTALTAWNGAACMECTPTQVLVANQCLDKAPNGGACLYNEQCSYTNGFCNKNVCGCQGTLQFVGTGCSLCDGIVRNNLCYPFASRGQPCQFMEQCTKTSGTECLNSICECPAGTTFNTASCVSTTTPATCQPLTEVKIGDTCHPLLNPNGFFCYYSQQCQGGSTCAEYVCKCPAAMPTVTNNVCTAGTGTGTGVTCSGNTVNVGGRCVGKTNDGVCLNVSCMSLGAAACTSYSPYLKCGYNAGGVGTASYFCCPS